MDWMTGCPAGTPGDGVLDRFLDPAAFNALPAPPWQYIVAVRIAVVARSALAEKSRPRVACDGTSPFSDLVGQHQRGQGARSVGGSFAGRRGLGLLPLPRVRDHRAGAQLDLEVQLT